MQGIDQCSLLVSGYCRQQIADLRPSSLRDRIDQDPALLGQTQSDQPSVTTLMATEDQPLPDQSITHTGRSRWSHVDCISERGKALRPTGCQHDKGAVLGERHLFGHVAERARRHGHQNATGAQHRIDDRVLADLRCELSCAHTLIIVVANEWRPGRTRREPERNRERGLAGPANSARRVARGRCRHRQAGDHGDRGMAMSCRRFAGRRLSWVHPALDEAGGPNDRAEDDRLHDRGSEADCCPEERHESVDHECADTYEPPGFPGRFTCPGRGVRSRRVAESHGSTGRRHVGGGCCHVRLAQ